MLKRAQAVETAERKLRIRRCWELNKIVMLQGGLVATTTSEAKTLRTKMKR